MMQYRPIRISGNFVIVSIWFILVRDPNSNSCIQKNSHLRVPTKHQYLNGISILIPMSRFFDNYVIDVDVLTPMHSPIHTGPTFGDNLMVYNSSRLIW